MMAFAAPLLAAVVLTQFQGGTFQARWRTSEANPLLVPGFSSSLPLRGAAGFARWKFRPRRTRTAGSVLRYLHYVGFTSTARAFGPIALVRRSWRTEFRPSAPALVLRTPAPKTIKLEGPDGQPLFGALVSPRVVSGNGMSFLAELPDTLSMPLAVMTGPEGTATVDYLADGDLLAAVRIKADAIGTQDIQLSEWSGRNAQGATINIRLQRTCRLTGGVRSRRPAGAEPAGRDLVQGWITAQMIYPGLW